MSSKIANDLILLIDLESAAVRGSLVLLGQAPPLVFSTYKVEIAPKSDDQYLIGETLKAVSTIVQAVRKDMKANIGAKEYKNFPRKISAVHFALCSPWIVSEAKSITRKSEKDFLVSRSHILSLMNDERAGFLPKADFPVSVIEEKVSEVRLNGYVVEDWENRLCKNLEVSFIVSVAGETMVKSLIAALDHIVREKAVFFHSSILLQTLGIHGNFENISNYILLHVHENFTDIAVIENLASAFFGVLPIGHAMISDKVRAIAGVDPVAANSMISLYGSGKLDETHGKGTIESVDRVLGEWQKSVFDFLEKEYPSIVPPAVPVAISTRIQSEAYAAILRKSFVDLPIILLKKEDLAGEVSYSAKAESSSICTLEIAAIHSLIKK